MATWRKGGRYNAFYYGVNERFATFRDIGETGARKVYVSDTEMFVGDQVMDYIRSLVKPQWSVIRAGWDMPYQKNLEVLVFEIGPRKEWVLGEI